MARKNYSREQGLLSLMKRISQQLNMNHLLVRELLEPVLDEEVYYDLIFTNKIADIAKAIYLTDHLYENSSTGYYKRIREDIIFSNKPIFLGLNKDHQSYYNVPQESDKPLEVYHTKEHHKCSFDFTEDQIIVKKILTKIKNGNNKSFGIKYQIFIYKYDIDLIGKQPKDIYDFTKSLPFEGCKYNLNRKER